MKKVLYLFTCLVAISTTEAQTIQNFVPKNGKEGTVIAIIGSGFTGNVEVAFGESSFVTAVIKATSEITAAVPSDATAGKVKVRIDGGTPVESAIDFRYVSITCYSPTTVRNGENILVHGTGFPTVFSTVFGEISHVSAKYPGNDCTENFAATILGNSKSLRLAIPSCVRSGDIIIKIKPNDGETEPDYKSYTFTLEDITIADPPEVTINSFSPTTAVVGEQVRISGNFPLQGNKMIFGDKEVNAGVSSGNNARVLTARVPAGARSGRLKVKANGSVIDTQFDIEILKHTVTSYSPKQFRSEHLFTVTGTNFSKVKDNNKICFATKCIAPTSMNKDGTELMIDELPDQLPASGTIRVRIGTDEVEAPGGEYRFRSQQAPLAITDFTPKTVKIGETITITGTGFEQLPKSNITGIGRANDATTNSRVVPYEVNEDQTELKVRVSGNVRGRESEITHFTVSRRLGISSYDPRTKAGLTVTETPEFVITNVSPNPARFGEVITITGTGFSTHAADNRVRFNVTAGSASGVSAYEVNEDATEIKVRVPIGGASGTLTVYGPIINPNKPEWSAEYGEIFSIIEVKMEITSYTPTEGAPGDEITINGSNFSPRPEYNEVCFSYLPSSGWKKKFVVAHWVNEEGTQLKARIGKNPRAEPTSELAIPPPPGFVANFPIAVRYVGSTNDNNYGVSGNFQNPDDYFIIHDGADEDLVVVSSFNPQRGGPGTMVTITGQRFSTVKGETTVQFGGVSSTPSSASATSLTVEVPYGAQTGPLRVSVLGLVAAESETDFTVPNPSVLNFTPSEAAPGETVRIEGENFSTTNEENAITFAGGAPATPSLSTERALTVTVPECAVTGRVSVDVNILKSTSKDNFTVTGTEKTPSAAPWISGVSPKSRERANLPVTIRGRYFSTTPEKNIVRFGGGAKASVDKSTFSEIQTYVPVGAKTGHLTVTVNGQRGVSWFEFELVGTDPAPHPDGEKDYPPTITKVDPLEGGADLDVRITGTGFSTTPLENTVTFGGGVEAEVLNAQERTLVVKVPQGARTGRINVTINGQTATSGKAFVVSGGALSPTAPVVSSFTPNTGDPGTDVTITGQNFSSTPTATSVAFGGVDAAVPSVSTPTSITVSVPQGAQTGPIRVTVNGETGTSTTNFTVPEAEGPPSGPVPVIVTFVPDTGEPETEVVITGQNFSDTPAANSVAFGGVNAAVPSVASTTSLTVAVPQGALTGPISVTVDGQRGTSTTSFTVPGTEPAPDPSPDGTVDPSVTNINPLSSSVGDMIKISGLGFSITPSENTVVFYGDAIKQDDDVETTPITSTEFSLDVEVPEGAQTGPVGVKVGGKFAVSGQIFAVSAGVFSTSKAESGLHVYPNPASEEIHFSGLLPTRRYTYKIYSLVGQVVLLGEARSSEVVDVSSLLAGKYVLILQTQDGDEVLRTRLLLK